MIERIIKEWNSLVWKEKKEFIKWLSSRDEIVDIEEELLLEEREEEV